MPATGAESTVVTATPEAVIAAMHKVLRAGKHTVDDAASTPERIAFVTRRTMLSWPLNGIATVTPTETGTELRVILQEQGKHQGALLDGVKNTKKSKKLIEDVVAAL